MEIIENAYSSSHRGGGAFSSPASFSYDGGDTNGVFIGHSLLAQTILFFTLQTKSNNKLLSCATAAVFLLYHIFLSRIELDHTPTSALLSETLVALIVGVGASWAITYFGRYSTCKKNRTRWFTYVAQSSLLWASFMYSDGVIRHTNFQVGLLSSYLLFSLFALALYILDRNDVLCYCNGSTDANAQCEWDCYETYDIVIGAWFAGATLLFILEAVLDTWSIPAVFLGRTYSYILFLIPLALFYFVLFYNNAPAQRVVRHRSNAVPGEKQQQQVLPVMRRTPGEIDPSFIKL
jgi:hypothetical protein